MFTKYLQDAFDAVVVIQLTNDEKFLFSKETKRPLEEFTRLGRENAKVRWLLCLWRRLVDCIWLVSALSVAGGRRELSRICVLLFSLCGFDC